MSERSGSDPERILTMYSDDQSMKTPMSVTPVDWVPPRRRVHSDQRASSVFTTVSSSSPSGSGCAPPAGSSRKFWCSTQMMGSGRDMPLAIPLSIVAWMARSERTGMSASGGKFRRSGSFVGRCVRSHAAESSTICESCWPS